MIEEVIADLEQLKKDRPGLVQRIEAMIAKLKTLLPPPGAAGH